MADRDDTLGVEQDRRKLDQEAPPEEGPPVAPMGSTYGTQFVESEEQARQVASEPGDEGRAPEDGLGDPRPPGEHTGQG